MMWWAGKFILFFIATLLLSIALSPLAVLWGSRVLQPHSEGKVKKTINVDPWILTFMTLVVSLLMVQYIDHRPLSSLGLHFYASWWKELGLGIALGSIMLVIVAVILRGWSKRYIFKRPAFTELTKMPAHFRGAFGEELAFRGYPMQTLVEGVGLYPAVAITSAFFGLLHYQRLGWRGVADASFAGLLLAVAVLKTKALWLAVGIHFGFNFIQAALGMRQLEEIEPLYQLASVIVIVIFLILLFWIPIHPHPVMEQLWQQYIQPAQP